MWECCSRLKKTFLGSNENHAQDSSKILHMIMNESCLRFIVWSYSEICENAIQDHVHNSEIIIHRIMRMLCQVSWPRSCQEYCKRFCENPVQGFVPNLPNLYYVPNHPNPFKSCAQSSLELNENLVDQFDIGVKKTWGYKSILYSK